MPAFLRDEPSESTEFEVRALSGRLETATGAERIRLLGRRGDLLRILGRVDAAQADLETALGGSADEDARVRNLIRLGTLRFYRGDYHNAEPELREAADLAAALGDELLLSFAHQHLGKCLAEMERYGEARSQFERALALRTDHPELAASSQRALKALDATR